MVYKVMVVEDSALMRSEISKIIAADPALEVITTAKNGLDAIEKLKEYKPDVVTMDINMPRMNGIEALKSIMDSSPLPVVMISTLTHEGAEETMDALHHGAFDFIPKPSGAISLDMATQSKIICDKVKTAAKSGQTLAFKRRNLRHNSRISRKPRTDSETNINRGLKDWAIGKVIGVGVSTGGPKTLMSILPSLPAEFPGIFLIAQHMPEKFTLSFANRLNSVCKMHVKEAEDGEILKKGCIYIAPGGKHMRVKNRNNKLFIIETVEDLPSIVYKPSVDVLFESMLDSFGADWMGVMLTGMGHDGAKALTSLKHQGGHTIAESEESCVVFGMPGKVVDMGGAEFILHQNDIINKILEIARVQS